MCNDMCYSDITGKSKKQKQNKYKPKIKYKSK